MTGPWRTGVLPQVPSFKEPCSAIPLAAAFPMGQWNSARLESASPFSRYSGSWVYSSHIFPGNVLHLLCVYPQTHMMAKGQLLARLDTDLVCLDLGRSAPCGMDLGVGLVRDLQEGCFSPHS